MKQHPLHDEPRYLMYSSCLTSFSVYYAYKNKYYTTFVSTFALFFTSINHWRKPELGFRRDMDRVVVLLNLPIQLISFRKSKRYYEYLLLTLLGSLCYPISIRIKNKRWSMFFHSLIHVFANLGNCLAMNT
jgi:hypothetical protein